MLVCSIFLHIRRGLVLFIFILMAGISDILLCESKLWSVADFPNPRLEPGRCGFIGNYNLNASRRVCDPDGSMTSTEVALLNELVLSSTTPCACEDGCDDEGFPIAIAIANRIKSTTSDGSFEPATVKCKHFAEALHKEWFPDDGCQDTTLIFFCFHYKELSVSIDQEVERVVSDLELAALARLSKNVLGVNAFSSTHGTESNLTQTFIGLEQVLNQFHDGITNGPSITSFTLYLIVVPATLVVLITIMCVLANWCCRPDLESSVDPKSGKHDVGHIVR